MTPAPNTLKISEIFASIQGEGARSGLPSIFLRLSGCSLRCDWCDTPAAWQPAQETDLETIAAKLAHLQCEWPAAQLVITGGEPLEQDLSALVGRLRRGFTTIAIETNGLHFQPLAIDWWSVSPKPEAGYRIHPRLIERLSEIKLIADDHLELAVLQKIRLLSEQPPIYIQPRQGDPQGMQRALALHRRFCRAGIANLRLGLQMHRLFDIP